MTGWRRYVLKLSGRDASGAELTPEQRLTAPLWDAEVRSGGADGELVGRVREYPTGGWRAEILALADGAALCTVAGDGERYSVADGAGRPLGSLALDRRRYWLRRQTWVVTPAGQAPVRAVRGRWWGWLLCLLATPLVTLVFIVLDGSPVIFTPHFFGWRFRSRGARVATVGERLTIRGDDPDPRLWLAAWVVDQAGRRSPL